MSDLLRHQRVLLSYQTEQHELYRLVLDQLLHTANNYTLDRNFHAKILVLFLSHMEYLWGNINAASSNSKYTDHIVLVTEQDARKSNKYERGPRILVTAFLFQMCHTAWGIGATVNLSPLDHATSFGNREKNPD